MNVFVSGVHGVGKTYLASRFRDKSGLMSTSASKLIAGERAMPNWDADRRVSEIDANQFALATSVRRHNDAGRRLLLDGHFVLLDSEGNFKRLGPEVLRALNLSGVVLIEAEAPTIAARIRTRDQREVNLTHTVEFITAERTQAKVVCEELGISLLTLESPSPEVFAKAIEILSSCSVP